MKPSDCEKVIGGLFVVPVIERAGYIKLQMVGIAAKDQEGNWSLHLLTKGEGSLTLVGKLSKEKPKQKKGKESKSIIPNDDLERSLVK